MNSGTRKLTIGVVVLVALVSFFIVRTLIKANHFTELEPMAGDACVPVAGMPGPEDLEIDPATGLAFVSSHDRLTDFADPDANVRGDIFVLDLGQDALVPVSLTDDVSSMPKDFKPHGISLYGDGSARMTMMVVSHPASGETIEIFDVQISEGDGGRPVARLDHRKSVTDALFTSPNDIVAVGHDTFYVTNDHAYRPGFKRFIEDYFQLDRATVVYYDGEKVSVAADGLTYPNGIGVSPDGRQIYVAETVDQSLRFYDRNTETGQLELRSQVPIRSGLDNIDVSESGAIWIGSHPKILQVAKHLEGGTALSPSEVIRVEMNEDGPGGRVDRIYLDLGGEISGSSVAAVHEGRMLIGQIVGDFVLACYVRHD